MTITPPPTPLDGPCNLSHTPTFEHILPPTPPHLSNHHDCLPHSRRSTAAKMHHPTKPTPQSEVPTFTARRDSEHLYVRPLTPRDAELCLTVSNSTASNETLEKELHASSPTSLGIFTSDKDHREQLLGYVIADQSSPEEEAGAGATLWIKQVAAEKDSYKVTLVKSFVERMTDAMVAKRLAMKVPAGKEGQDLKEWWCRKLGFSVSEMGDIVYLACF